MQAASQYVLPTPNAFIFAVSVNHFFVTFFFLITHFSIYFAGTYFTAIMFMVASSCVTTIMILNYHHRMADTHEMPDWVLR